MSKPEDLKLTPEQQKAVMDVMATVTQVVSKVIAGVTEAIMPIIKAYNALPEELKQPKSGTQDYWVTQDAAGKFIFKKQTSKGASK